MNDEKTTFQYIDRDTYKDDGKLLMYFPHDGSYVEILGHKIDFQGGYEEFVEHLKKLATYEEENKKLKEENKKLRQWDCNKDSRNSRQRVANKKLIKDNKRLKKQYCERVDCAARLGESKKVEELKASVKYYVDILTDLKKWLEEDEEKSMISFADGKHFNYKDVLNKIKELEEKNNAK